MLKISGEFVGNLVVQAAGRAMICAILSLVHDVGHFLHRIAARLSKPRLCVTVFCAKFTNLISFSINATLQIIHNIR
jgi:hypothetical protein